MSTILVYLCLIIHLEPENIKNLKKILHNRSLVTEGYFTLENADLPKFLTAGPESSLKIEGNYYFVCLFITEATQYGGLQERKGSYANPVTISYESKL